MSGKTILSRERYEELLKPLTRELSDAARWIPETGQRVVVVFEGRDTAGKGGSIDMIARTSTRASATSSRCPRRPSASSGQWYFQRYVEHLPSKGEIVLFDRSWYNRAGVERVMGFCTAEADRGLPRGGAGVREAARRRRHPAVQILAVLRPGEAGGAVRERLNNPLRRWKLSPIDIDARTKYDDYTRARERDAEGDAHRLRAVDAGRFQRPADRPADAAARPPRRTSRHASCRSPTSRWPPLASAAGARSASECSSRSPTLPRGRRARQKTRDLAYRPANDLASLDAG